jgi:tetratricopeptide (TPR) repeat protein
MMGAVGAFIYLSGISGISGINLMGANGAIAFSLNSNQSLSEVTTFEPIDPVVPATQSCQQEQTQTAELQIIRLIQLTDRELSEQRFASARKLFRHTLQTIQSLPDPQLRSNWITNLINEETSGEHNVWLKLIQLPTVRETEPTVTVLEDAVATIQTLDTGYSFVKANSFIRIANAYTTLGKADRSEEILALAQQTTQTIEGAEFSVLILTQIAEAYLDLGENALAIGALNQAEQYIDVVDLNDLQRENLLAQVGMIYAKAQEVEAALEIAEGSDTALNKGSIELEVVRAYLGKNQLEQAYALTQTIAQPESQAIAFVEIANQLFEQGELTEADARFEKAVSIARSLTDAEHILLQVITAYQHASPDRALTAAQTLRSPELRANALTQVALAYTAIGQTTNATIAAERAVQALQQIPPDWITFNARTFVNQAIEAQAYELAIRLTESLTDPFLGFERAQLLLDIAQAATDRNQFSVAQAAVEAIPPENVEMRSRGWQTIAVSYINVNQPDAALELLNQIDRAYPVYRVQMLSMMARQFELTGNSKTAFDLFEQAQQEIRAIGSPTETLQALGTLVVEYRNANQPIDSSLIQQIQQTTLEFGDDTTSNFHLRSVVEQLLAANHYETAFQIAQIVPSQYERDSLLEQISQQALGSVSEQMILQTIDAIDSPEAQTRQLLSLIDRHLFMQSSRDVDLLLNKSIQITRTIPDPETRVLVFGNEGGTVVEDEFDRASLLEVIALRYAQLGQADAAFEVANDIQNAAERDRVIQRIRCHQRES